MKKESQNSKEFSNEKIRVRAVITGEYGLKLRRPDDVFDLEPMEKTIVEPDGDGVVRGKVKAINGVAQMRMVSAEEQFSATWMERVDPNTPLSASNPRQALDQKTNALKGLVA